MFVYTTFNISRMQQIISERAENYVLVSELHLKILVTKSDKRQVEKMSYPREKIDDRQSNTILLPFVCKMWYIPRVQHILQTNGRGIVFACLSSIFSRG